MSVVPVMKLVQLVAIVFPVQVVHNPIKSVQMDYAKNALLLIVTSAIS